MKQIFSLLVICLTLFACNTDDGDQTTFYVLPIESIELPESFTLNGRYTIPITFLRPTNCHAFNGIISNSYENERTLAVSTFTVSTENCTNLNEQNGLSNQEFEFEVKYDYTYVFKIWKGKDDQGEDIFEIIEVPVEQ